jgi:hypothetical protein
MTRGGSQQSAKEMHLRESVPFGLHKDIEGDAVLIDGSPEVVSDAIDLEEDFIEMPLIARSGTSSPKTVGILFTKLVTPASDGLVTDQHAAAITSSTSRKLTPKRK